MQDFFFPMTTFILWSATAEPGSRSSMGKAQQSAFSLNNLKYMTFIYIYMCIYIYIHIYIHTYTYVWSNYTLLGLYATALLAMNQRDKTGMSNSNFLCEFLKKKISLKRNNRLHSAFQYPLRIWKSCFSTMPIRIAGLN